MTELVVLSHAQRSVSVTVWLCCMTLLAVGTAYADTQPPCAPAVLTLTEAAELLRVGANNVEELAERNEIPARRVGTEWRFNCAALMAWLNGDWVRIAANSGPNSAESAAFVRPEDSRLESQSRLTTQDLADVMAAGTAVGQDQSSPSPAAASSGDGQTEPIGEAPEERTAEEIFLRDQRVLLAPGDLTFNFGQFYAESNAQLLTLIDDGAVLGTVEQESLITTFQARVGVGRETELFAGTSYFNQDSDLFFGSEKLASSDRSEFGDVIFGVRHTLMQEGLGRPNIIATLSGSIPTGDTSDALGAGLAFVKSIDPVALFATINYTHTFSEDFADVTLLEPEDRLNLSFGFALAVNDTLSLSTSISGVFTGATAFTNAELRQQDSYSLGFGLTSWLARGLYIEPSVSFRLGGPGDNFAFGISLFTFTP